MTAQEAIKQIEKTALMRYSEIHGKGGGELAEALRKAISALEKQIPKKPHYQYDGQGDQHECCPKCGCLGFDSYCIKCGQKIDWSDRY